MSQMSNLDVLIREAEANIEAAGARTRAATDSLQSIGMPFDTRRELLSAIADLYDGGIDFVMELKKTLCVEPYQLDTEQHTVDPLRDLSAQVAALTAALVHAGVDVEPEEPLNLDELPKPTGQTLEIELNTGEVFEVTNVDSFVLKLDSGEWPVGWMAEDDESENPAERVKKALWFDAEGNYHPFDTRYRDPKTQGLF